MAVRRRRLHKTVRTRKKPVSNRASSVIVSIDLENIIVNDYGLRLANTPFALLFEFIMKKAKSLGHITRASAFYSNTLGSQGLLLNLQAYGIQPYPVPVRSSGVSLVDNHLITETLIQFFEVKPKPKIVVLVSGDQGFLPLLQKVSERKAKTMVMGFRSSMSRALQQSELREGPVIYLDEVLAPLARIVPQPPRSSLVRTS